MAERWYGRLLAAAVALFAACGPAHALGHTDLVYHAVLVGLVLSALAVPMGLLALRRQPPPDPAPAYPAHIDPAPAGPAPGSARWHRGRSV